jgi:hypothetical protein
MCGYTCDCLEGYPTIACVRNFYWEITDTNFSRNPVNFGENCVLTDNTRKIIFLIFWRKFSSSLRPHGQARQKSGKIYIHTQGFESRAHSLNLPNFCLGVH